MQTYPVLEFVDLVPVEAGGEFNGAFNSLAGDDSSKFGV